MQFDRRSGVFRHVTSLPGPGGVGTLGRDAHEFVDYLARAGQSLWQVCPLGPTSGAHGDSPYQSFSAFAGNPLLVSLDDLVERGWLPEGALAERPDFSPHRVEYDAVRAYKEPLLREAFAHFRDHADDGDRAAFDAFSGEQDWLTDYALFVALKDEFGGRAWTQWPEGCKLRDPGTLDRYREELAEEIAYREFAQFCFDIQWSALRDHASEQGVDIVGDLPIYVGLDSADVWATPSAFQLDEQNEPTAVAGVPPAPTDPGQRWGNPLYDWEALRESGFGWWLRRFDRLLSLVDIVRIDHFKGFDEYWAIPAEADDPADGEWRQAPGEAFFGAIEAEFGAVPAIAEDLGHVTESMAALRRRFGLPGMRVVQYADWCAEDHMYQPHTYTEDTVAYTSTHDTNTVMGWYHGLDDHQRDCLHYYLGHGEDVNWHLLESVWNADSVFAMTQLQDPLGLGSDARFNTPGTAEGNWDWRITREGLDAGIAESLHDMSERYGRLHG